MEEVKSANETLKELLSDSRRNPIRELYKAITKASKEQFTTPSYNGKDEVERTSEDTIEAFSDYLDNMYYIRGMKYLSRAVGYYLQYSTDNETIKSEVLSVFESVISNDESYKEAYDRLFILRNALNDLLRDAQNYIFRDIEEK